MVFAGTYGLAVQKPTLLGGEADSGRGLVYATGVEIGTRSSVNTDVIRSRNLICFWIMRSRSAVILNIYRRSFVINESQSIKTLCNR